ncbi:MAG TPA: hypothetical protein VD931_08610 [Baekduia sp.]|nr:hypothetical protein [Baekduia sp.]
MSSPARRPSSWALAAGALALALMVWGWTARQDRLELERRAGAVAGQIAGRDVRVRCPGVLRRTFAGFSVTSGHVEFSAEGTPGDEAWLEKGPCAALRRLLDGDAAADLACVARAGLCDARADELARAVDVLAHESQHLAGILAEDVAECRALQAMAQVAVALGADPAAAQALAALQHRTSYHLMPARYQHQECRPGGALDLTPRDGRWP